MDTNLSFSDFNTAKLVDREVAKGMGFRMTNTGQYQPDCQSYPQDETTHIFVPLVGV
jgi:hypothetical protein